jgi:hypothetical protein
MSRHFTGTIFHGRRLRREQLPPLLAVLAAAAATTTTSTVYPSISGDSSHQSKQYSLTEASDKNDKKKKDDSSPSLFDITKQWEEVKSDWESMFNTSKDISTATAPPPTETNKRDEFSIFDQFREAVTSAMKGEEGDKTADAPPPPSKENYKDMGKTLFEVVQQQIGVSSKTTTVQDIVTQARNMEDQGDVNDTVSLGKLLEIAKHSKEQLEFTLQDFLGNMDLPALSPTDIYYFLEHEDETKNPSVKRRQHRFFSGVDIDQVNQLNEQLQLALLSYSDSLEEIQTSLEKQFQYELAYCDMNSTPGRPSHFIAVNKNQSASSSIFASQDSLEVLLVIRGTKTITDIITDLLCDASPYRGGYCHKGIMESGQYLANKHTGLFKNLLQVSGKKKINLTLIGHSLGAGAAAIAGMELKEQSYLDVQVVGFGCPALLSEGLSQSQKDFVTTVVADNDFIPRMSTATMVNIILDIATYDWTKKAQRDIEDAIDEVSSYLPRLLSGYKSTILDIVNDNPMCEPAVLPEKRMQPLLFPPGKCIHLYRDGFGISGNVVPCTYFNEIDVHRRMIHDHLVDSGYQLIFLGLMRQHHGDHYFQFDSDNSSTG